MPFYGAEEHLKVNLSTGMLSYAELSQLLLLAVFWPQSLQHTSARAAIYHEVAVIREMWYIQGNTPWDQSKFH